MMERLIEMVKQAVTNLGDGGDANVIKTYFANTISHIQKLKSSDDGLYYDNIVV